MKWTSVIVLLLLLALTACTAPTERVTLRVEEVWTEQTTQYVAGLTSDATAEQFRADPAYPFVVGSTYCVAATPPDGAGIRVLRVVYPAVSVCEVTR